MVTTTENGKTSAVSDAAAREAASPGTAVPTAATGVNGEAVNADELPRRGLWPRILAAVLISLVIGLSHGLIRDPVQSRAAMIAGACLVLWLLEAIPLFATTMILGAGAALLLGPIDDRFAVGRVLTWPAKPVLALFFGGLALSVAGSRHGIDRAVAFWMMRISGGGRLRLLLLTMMGTAALSMWMSNIAAAAMMLAAIRPLAGTGADSARFRSAMLLGVAFGADFGGMATPIGSGPNLIAIGTLAPVLRITFVQWMTLAVPLTALMLAIAYLLLVGFYRVGGSVGAAGLPPVPLTRQGRAVVAVFLLAIAAWLLEPVHGVSASVVAIIVTAALFGSSLLRPADLARIDWATLLLVAGGLMLGELFELSGLAAATSALAVRALPPSLFLLSLVAACALLSSVASNTASAAILIQIGMHVEADPATVIIIALAASMGVPFVISTPQNAMVYGQGGLRARDLLLLGSVLMLLGCAILVLTGPMALRLFGIAGVR